METFRRIRLALAAFGMVVVLGTLGYLTLGFTPLEALYQTVTTVSTVGFGEVRPLSAPGRVLTMVIILLGVGVAAYAFSVMLEALVEGHLRQHLKERRMARDIARMTGHTIICGWGRVGQATAAYLQSTGYQVVVIDRDAERMAGIDLPHVVGDVTDDDVLRAAGIDAAQALIAALDTDADNVFVTLSSRTLRPDLVIVARARDEGSKSKLLRAGANRAVNPQLIGGRRMATFAQQRHVAEFLDDVMHDDSLNYRLEQFEITASSPLAGRRISDAKLGQNGTAQLLAVRAGEEGKFLASPGPDTTVDVGNIMIVVGTSEQLAALRTIATG